MHTSEFKKAFERAKSVNIVNDDLFNCAGWFWINLTELQHKKMYGLLISQGNIPQNGEIKLKNGLGILDIDNEKAMVQSK